MNKKKEIIKEGLYNNLYNLHKLNNSNKTMLELKKIIKKNVQFYFEQADRYKISFREQNEIIGKARNDYDLRIYNY